MRIFEGEQERKAGDRREEASKGAGTSAQEVKKTVIICFQILVSYEFRVYVLFMYVFQRTLPMLVQKTKLP